MLISLNKSMIRFIDISKIDDSVEQRIKEQGAGSQQQQSNGSKQDDNIQDADFEEVK